MFRTFRRALISVLGAGPAVAGGMTVAAADPAVQDVVAAKDGTTAADSVIIVTLLSFALGWVVIELRRSKRRVRDEQRDD